MAVKAESTISLASVKTVNDASIYASQKADEAKLSADNALESANNANLSAQTATMYANNALNQLSEVEKVVDVLNWATEHGEYALTTDTEVVLGKYYFELSDGKYTVVTTPADDPQTAGYYELTGVDEAISNYVTTHLALSDDGLFVQMDDNACKIQINANGIYLYDASGTVIASYSSSVVLGDPIGLHMMLSAGRLGFWQGSTEVAWINTDSLFISNAEITQTLRIGNFIWKPRSGRLTLMYSPQE